MKESAGEANLTVITIVLIALVLGVGTIIVTRALGSTAKASACDSINGEYKAGRCIYKNQGLIPRKCTTGDKNKYYYSGVSGLDVDAQCSADDAF